MSEAPQAGDNSNAQFKALVERIEREEAAKADIAEGIKEIYQEAKSGGWDVKAIRKLVGIRRQDQNKRIEAQLILENYMNAMGMAV